MSRDNLDKLPYRFFEIISLQHIRMRVSGRLGFINFHISYKISVRVLSVADITKIIMPKKGVGWIDFFKVAHEGV